MTAIEKTDWERGSHKACGGCGWDKCRCEPPDPSTCNGLRWVADRLERKPLPGRVGGHWTLPGDVELPPMTPDQKRRFQGVLDWFALGLGRAMSIDHNQFWGTFSVQEGNAEPQPGFAFIAVGNEVANRARVLLEPLPLCTTDLGDVPRRHYPADAGAAPPAVNQSKETKP